MSIKLDLPDSIANLFSKKTVETILKFRRHLHKHPELSGQEHKTQAKILETLEKAGIKTAKKIGGTGVMVNLPGKKKSKKGEKNVVVIRGDIDALPIHENTGLDYESKVPGVMHACGHDVHSSWAMAAAIHIHNNPCEGPVRIIFQPAEETATGAQILIKENALKDACAILGAHVDRNYTSPTIICHPGAISSNSDKFEYTITGSSAHGARPQEGQDPFIGAAKLIMAIQAIVSRKIAPHDQAVISIGKVDGGNSHNVIPEKVTMIGTIRSFSKETRKTIHQNLKNLCHLGKALDLTITCDINMGSPAIINGEDIVAISKDVGEKLVGKKCHPLVNPNFGAEDFGYYLEKIPGQFFRIGCRKEKEPVIPAHNPKFYANDESIFVGAAILVETAKKLSSREYSV